MIYCLILLLIAFKKAIHKEIIKTQSTSLLIHNVNNSQKNLLHNIQNETPSNVNTNLKFREMNMSKLINLFNPKLYVFENSIQINKTNFFNFDCHFIAYHTFSLIYQIYIFTVWMLGIASTRYKQHHKDQYQLMRSRNKWFFYSTTQKILKTNDFLG